MLLLEDQRRQAGIQPARICTLMPLTLDRVGSRAALSTDEPMKITSIEEAFHSFQPRLVFRGMLGPKRRELVLDFEFRSIKDFDPSSLQERQTSISQAGERVCFENGLADLHDEIETLAMLVRCWQEPPVGELWNNPEKREGLLATLDAARRHWCGTATSDSRVRQLLPGFKNRFPTAVLPIACLAEVASEFRAAASRDEAVEIMEERLQGLVALRDDALKQIFDIVRPIERSYRLLQLFFENARGSTPDSSVPVELYVFDLDTTCAHDASVVDAIEHFIAGRNDRFNNRDDLCTLVFQSFPDQQLRESLERMTANYGVGLISDLGDVVSGENLRRELLVGGRYEFVRFPETNSFQHVLVAGQLHLRPAYWFDEQFPDTDLAAPSSLIFSAVWARDERVQRQTEEPCIWRIFGGPEPTTDLTQSDLGHSRIERQVVTAVRAPDGSPAFYGCRPAADSSCGILRFPTGYRVGRCLQRWFHFYHGHIVGQLSTREAAIANLEAPLQRILDDFQEAGSIEGYNLFVDKSSKKLAKGMFDVTLTIRVPGGCEVRVEL